MKFVTRAQELGKKAAELSQAVHALPAKAAQIREAVTMTGGELKQLRSDVQTSLHALKAESEEHLLGSMREINDHAALFEEAGYLLNGMDLDLALQQRLTVYLEKTSGQSQAVVRGLISRSASPTIRSILSGILKAEETAANVELSRLVYSGLEVHVGAIPTVRMNWREPYEPPSTEQVSPPLRAVAPAPVAPVAPVAPAPSASMFELRPLPGGSVGVEAKAADMIASPAIAPAPLPTAPAAWSQDALARFKQMPGISKYKR